MTGPVFRWSDTWQLVMNTLSSIIAFLMVFLIQRSQNKDTLAVHRNGVRSPLATYNGNGCPRRS